MKLGVLSDIHSNYYALKACVDYMVQEGVSEFLLLGDYVSDTSFPEKTMALLYELQKNYTVHMLRGNREEYLLEQRAVQMGIKDGIKWPANSASGNLLFTYERLSQKDWELFESLPITFRYEYKDFPAITCCHGSPNNSRELLRLNGDNTKLWLEQIDTDYLLAAHTHYPGKLEYQSKYYFNTGCVGIAIADAGYAQCLILHGIEETEHKKWEPEFLKIPYDTTPVIKDIFTSGLYDMAPWFLNSNLQILLTGIDHSAEMVAMAIDLQRKATGREVTWPLIEEAYFQQAAEILGIPDYKISLDPNVTSYARQAKASWGKTEAFGEYEEKTKNLSVSEMNTNAQALMDICAQFGNLKTLPPSDTMVQAQVKKLQDFITEHFYTCTDQILATLGKMYSGGGSITENINKVGGDGAAEFAGEAIKIYCASRQKQLSTLS